MKTTPPFPSGFPGRWVGFFFLALIPLTVLVPYGAEPVWLAQDLTLRWASAAVFLFCLSQAPAKPSFPAVLRLDSANLVFLLLAGWVLLSAENSREPFGSFYAVKSFLAILLWWFSLRSAWSRWPGIFPWFERAFLGTALAAGAWIVLTTGGHALAIPFFLDRTIPRQGTFPNQNIAAGFLGMALLWGTHQKLNQKPVSWAALAFLLLAWGMTQSRGSFVAMLFVAVLYLVIHMKAVEERIARWRTSQWLLFGAAALYLAASVSLMINRVLNAETVDPRSYFRIDVWISSLKMILAQPLFGFGPGTFGDVYPYYRPAAFWNISNPFAHNEFLQVAAECGIPALLLVLLLLWIFIREFLPDAWKTRGFKSVEASSAYRELAFYLVLLEASHNLVDFTFHEWSHRLVLMGFVTFALGGKPVQEGMEAEFRLSRPVLLAGIFLALATLVWVQGWGAYRDYRSRFRLYQGILLERRGDLDGAEKLARESLRSRSDSMEGWNLLGLVETARAEALPPGSSARESRFKSADEDFQKALQSSPYALAPRQYRIENLVERGRLAQALDLENQLLRDGPQVPDNDMEAGDILIRMGKAKEALGPAQDLIGRYPYYLPGYFLKAKVLELLGRPKEALRVFEDARDMLRNIGLSDPSGRVEPNIERLKGFR
jgi:O-antigen ligase